MLQDPAKNDRPQEPQGQIPPQPELPVQGQDQPQLQQGNQGINSKTVVPGGNKNIWQSKELYITLGLLGVIILLGAFAFSILERWRRRQIDSSSDSYTGVQLTNFREMFENGEITQSEYERIRDKMASKIKQDVLSKRMKPHPRINPNTTPSTPGMQPNVAQPNNGQPPDVSPSPPATSNDTWQPPDVSPPPPPQASNET